MRKEWKCYHANKEEVEQLEKQYHLTKLVSSILVNRNIKKEKQIKKFLAPTRHDFYDPFLMPDMEKAVERILKAIQHNEKMLIYGDYDVDGITSITVLKKFFQDREISIDYYIPNRIEEGYGLNKEAIKHIAKNGYQLIITVDCGITSVEEVALANDLGVKIVITDHHEVPEELPEAIAVVDAKRKDSIYPFNQLAGVGVAFKLIQALSKKMDLPEKEYLKYLDIVCIGTISDIVPLVDENRVITKLGLKLVEQTKNVGLQELLKICAYSKVDSNTISFGIAPRINACGRLADAKTALELFLTEDEEKAKAIATQLNIYNQQRQEMEKNIYDEAVEKLEEEKNTKNILVLAKEGWHHGVIGIVASKITEKYFKPSILICIEGKEAKGSGRSIPGFNLHEALTKNSLYLEKFGGHAMAVGVTLKTENFPKFKKELQEYGQNSHICDIIPIIYIDEEITFKDISIETVAQLDLLQPFGEANKEPIFACRNVKIQSIRTLSEGKHIKLTLKDDNFYLDVVGFQMGNLAEEFKLGDKVDVVGTLEINEFNGAKKVQMRLIDMILAITK